MKKQNLYKTVQKVRKNSASSLMARKREEKGVKREYEINMEDINNIKALQKG